MGMKLTKESIKFVLNSAICIEMSEPTRLHVLPLLLLIKLNRFVWCFNFFSIIFCYFHGTMKNLGWRVVAHSKYRTIVLPFEIFKLILSTGNIELALWMLPMSTFLIFVSSDRMRLKEMAKYERQTKRWSKREAYRKCIAEHANTNRLQRKTARACTSITLGT